MKKGIVILLIFIVFFLLGFYLFFNHKTKDTENFFPSTVNTQPILDVTSAVNSPSTAPLLETSSVIISEETTAAEILIDGIRPSEVKMGSFYFTHLTPDEQSLYRFFYDHVTIFENEIEIESYQFNKVVVNKIVKAMMSDSPELFWLSESFRFYSNVSDIVTKVEFFAQEREAIERANLEINAIAETWIQYANSLPNDYEKIKFIYEQIIHNTDYVPESENNQDIRSVFLQKQSVCAGYAKAFQFLLDRMGIYNLFVGGEISNGNPHAWNMVRLDDKYYWVDATWGDPVFPDASRNDGTISYNYLCITDEEIFRTHIPVFDHTGEIPPFFELPICDSTEYDYYRLYENYIESFDYDYLVNAITDGYWAGKEFYSVKCSSKELWEQIYREIAEGNLLSDVYQSIDAVSNKSGTMTAFYYDDKMCTLKIILFSETE